MSEAFCGDCGRPLEEGACCRVCLLGGLSSSEDDLFELPDQLGPFEVNERIGRGGSGEVWRAFQPGPDREVALKVFLDHRLGGRVDRSLFLHEARVLGKLDHPGIVPVFATGEEGGFLYIASRWMSGGTLEAKIRGGAYRNQPRRAVVIIRDLARAVAHAHQHGLVHRDIKPANVLLDDQGAPFLADFGIAISQEDGSHGVTSGTPAYMAPEQAGGKGVTTATDVWALGVLLREILTGLLPEPEVRKLPRSYDRRLRAIVGRCLEVDPGRRYQEAASLAEELEAFLGGRCVEALPEVFPVRVCRWAGRRPGQALTTVAAIALGVTAVGLGWHSWTATRESERRAAADAAKYRERAYVADVYLATRSLADHQLGVTQEMLARHIPEPGESDLRGYEWHALKELAKGDPAVTYEDHRSPIGALAFSPDSRYLLSACRGGELFVREVETGAMALALPDPDAPTGAGEIPLMTMLAARSPEALKMLLTGGISPDGFRMRGRPSKIGEVTAAAWAPDGKSFATGGAGSFLRVWSFPAGELIAVVPQMPTDWVAFSKDGKRLISMTHKKHESKVVIRDVKSLKQLWSVDSLEMGVALHESKLAVVRRGDRHLLILNEEDGRVMADWPTGTTVGQLVWSADGQVLYGTSWDGDARFSWRAEDGRALKSPQPVAKKIRAMAAHGGKLLLVGEEQVVRIENHEGQSRLLSGHTDEILAVAVSPDGVRMASAGKDQSVRLWVDPWQTEGALPFAHGEIETRMISPDGESWLVQMKPDGVELWGEAGRLHVLGNQRMGLGFDAGGGRFATWRKVDGGAEVEWWEVESGEAAGRFHLGLSEDDYLFGWGELVGAVQVGKEVVIIFDAETGEVKGELADPQVGAVRLVVSPSQKEVLLVGWPWNVQMGHLDRGWQPRRRLSQGSIGPVTFSPDGSLFVIGTDQNVIKIYDVESGDLVETLIGHRAELRDLSFTPDGRTLASSAKDRTLRLWHVPTWSPLGTLDAERNHHHIRFDADGKRIRVVPAQAPPFAIPNRRTTE